MVRLKVSLGDLEAEKDCDEVWHCLCDGMLVCHVGMVSFPLNTCGSDRGNHKFIDEGMKEVKLESEVSHVGRSGVTQT